MAKRMVNVTDMRGNFYKMELDITKFMKKLRVDGKWIDLRRNVALIHKLNKKTNDMRTDIEEILSLIHI